MPDSLIFDLDGTLWDTAGLCALAWNESFQEQNVHYRKITSKDISDCMGKTGEEIRAIFFSHRPPTEGARILKRCFEKEVELLRDRSGILYPGVEKGLSVLAQAYPLFLVSNCDPPYLKNFLETSGVGALFKDSECYGNTLQPKGENIRAVIERNHLKKAVYIGDTAGDQEAAERAGIPFIYARYGFGTSTKNIGVIDRFEDLPKFLSTMPAH